MRAGKGDVFPYGFFPTFYPDRLDEPLRARKPQRIFLASMGDLLDPWFPREVIVDVLGTVAAARWHTFLLLTKQPARLRDLFTDEDAPLWRDVRERAEGLIMETLSQRMYDTHIAGHSIDWPLENLHVGITAEGRSQFIDRWPYLRETPAALRFVSWEPALAELGNLEQAFAEGLGWVIAGSKTPGKPLHELKIPTACPSGVTYRGFFGTGATIYDVADQCHDAGVPLFYKHGGQTPALEEFGVFAQIPEVKR
jgi:protein gp37